MNIKGPKGPGGPNPTPEVAKPAGSKAEGGSFREVLEAKANPQAQGVQQGVEQVIASLGERVRAGQLTPQEARQELVSEIAKAVGPMPDEMRVRLESFLEAQLQSDPNLSRHAAVIFESES